MSVKAASRLSPAEAAAAALSRAAYEASIDPHVPAGEAQARAAQAAAAYRALVRR